MINGTERNEASEHNLKLLQGPYRMNVIVDEVTYRYMLENSQIYEL